MDSLELECTLLDTGRQRRDEAATLALGGGGLNLIYSASTATVDMKSRVWLVLQAATCTLSWPATLEFEIV